MYNKNTIWTHEQNSNSLTQQSYYTYNEIFTSLELTFKTVSIQLIERSEITVPRFAIDWPYIVYSKLALSSWYYGPDHTHTQIGTGPSQAHNLTLFLLTIPLLKTKSLLSKTNNNTSKHYWLIKDNLHTDLTNSAIKVPFIQSEIILHFHLNLNSASVYLSIRMKIGYTPS